MTKRRIVIVVLSLVAIAALAFGYSFFNGHKTPVAQKPLFDLTAQSLETFRVQFNAAKDRTRVILLLSPT